MCEWELKVALSTHRYTQIFSPKDRKRVRLVSQQHMFNTESNVSL